MKVKLPERFEISLEDFRSIDEALMKSHERDKKGEVKLGTRRSLPEEVMTSETYTLLLLSFVAGITEFGLLTILDAAFNSGITIGYTYRDLELQRQAESEKILRDSD